LLSAELAKFTGQAEIFISHLKPDEADLIMREVESCQSSSRAKMLINNQEFIF
jgi:hypothetical protein